jgi:pimeloyl-ACP methyl ester carboxylesterase
MFRFGKLSAMLIVVCLALVESTAVAQRAGGKVSPPKDMKLTTKDGVRLGVTYYASTEGKEAVPVVLLHDYMESRAVFNALARALQGPPNGSGPSLAVVTVDFRGHGESKTIELRDGRTIELDTARLRSADFQDMVRFDMEAVRKFLVTKNDESALNLNKLCLVGSGLGANVAVYWTAKDWNTPPLAVGKQGQDVKALVLVSPKWSYRGLPLKDPMKNRAIQQRISTLIAFGENDSKAARDAKNIHKILERYHPDPPNHEIREKKDLFFVPVETSLQGTELLLKPQFGLFPMLQGFVEARLVEKDFEWIKRRGN